MELSKALSRIIEVFRGNLPLHDPNHVDVKWYLDDKGNITPEDAYWIGVLYSHAKRHILNSLPEFEITFNTDEVIFTIGEQYFRLPIVFGSDCDYFNFSNFKEVKPKQVTITVWEPI